MAIDFPASPTLNQLFAADDKLWQWDGVAWTAYLAANNASLHGASHGSAGVDPVTLAQSQVTGLTTSLSGKASTTHAASHASAGSDPITIAASQVTGIAVLKTGTTGTIDLSQASLIPSVQTSDRNKIINGGFDVWQRGTSFTNPLGTFTADRWSIPGAEAASVISRQAFSVGNPITGYEPTYFMRFSKNGTTANLMFMSQKIEDVRTFAGQTITISYWMKASQSFLNEPLIQQNFGTAGSAEVYTTTSTHNVTTSWQRYSLTISVPSILGKTLGAGSFLGIWPVRQVGIVNVDVDIWGVQAESGSVATPFEVKPYAQELRDCQRYCFNFGSSTGNAHASGLMRSTTAADAVIIFPVQMRNAPSAPAATSGNLFYVFHTADTFANFSGNIYNASNHSCVARFTPISALTAGMAIAILNTSSTPLIFSAEL